MKKLFQKIINLLVIACFLTVNLYIPEVNADSKTLGQIKKELAQFKKDYEDNKLQQQLTQEERENIKSNIKKIELTISNTQNEIYNLQQEIEKLNQDIVEKEKEIDTILNFYQISNGESTYLEYAFGAKDFTDFIYRVAVSEQLTSYNSSLVEQYKKSIEESKKKSEELNIKIVDLEKQQSSLQVELSKVITELNELSDDALSIEQQIELAESQVQMYVNLGCKDDENLETCARKKLPSDTNFWRPLKQGYITGYPGPRILAGISGNVHHGLDMSNNGANYTDYPVYSIANGVVMYVVSSAYSGCGGRKVYIQHNINGKLYVSSYWHLRSVNVKKDQVVTKDTQIGVMGGTESWDPCTTGAHLHLELSLTDLTKIDFSKPGLSVISISRGNWLYPQNYINFPNRTYLPWTDRITKY